MKFATLMLIALIFLSGCTKVQNKRLQPGTEPASNIPAQETALAATHTAILPSPDLLLESIDVEERLLTDLYQNVSPSVVHINARIITMNFFFGPMPSDGTGSGFVIDEDGHIITNFHVIDGAESIEVTFSDETQVPAEVIGADPLNDLAVLRPSEVPEQILPLSLGSSADLRIGQRAIAIGNPFGLDRTLTTGVISGLGRPLLTEQEDYIFNVIQTDAAINPGNSGGPLLDSRGHVIGVNTAIRLDAEGIGFAVPVDTLKRVLRPLIEEGSYPHPWLGILGYSITPELADALDLPVSRGVMIAQLYRNGPALQAGIHGADQEVIVGNRRILIGGDIVTHIDDQPLDDWTDYLEFLELQTNVGDVVALTILREGQQQVIEVVTVPKP